MSTAPKRERDAGDFDEVGASPGLRSHQATYGQADRHRSLGASLCGKTVLLTGATGSVGRVVLHQLLRHFPGIGKVLCLVREDSEGGRSAHERLASEVLQRPPMTNLERALVQRGESFSSVVETVQGTLEEERLGLTAEAWGRLAGRVDLIINCAGLVEFTGPLDGELSANVDGPCRLLALAEAAARAGRHAITLCHMSTCFVSGSRQGRIEEEPPVFSSRGNLPGGAASSVDAAQILRELRQAVDQIRSTVPRGLSDADPQRRARDLKRRMVDEGQRQVERLGWPNVYTLTKALGEQALWEARRSTRLVIVRPSVVGASLHEPSGWLDGRDSVTPIAALMWGGNRLFPIRRRHRLDVVPVDLVANATLVIAALASRDQASGTYHLCSSAHSCPTTELFELTWRGLVAAANARGGHRLPGAPIALPDWLYRRALRPSLDLAAVGVEAAARVMSAAAGAASTMSDVTAADRLPTRRARTVSRELRTTRRFLDAYAPFFARYRPVFDSRRTLELYARLSDAERAQLPFDPEHIDWTRYWLDCQIPAVLRYGFPRLGLLPDAAQAGIRLGDEPAGMRP